VTQNDAQARARIAELEAANAQMRKQLTDELGALRRSLLDLNNQIEQTRSELAVLRGGNEQQMRDLSELSKRQQEMAQALDERMRRLEPLQVTLDGKTFATTPQEKRLYDEAVGHLRDGAFDQAAAALASFEARFPDSGYVESARFWRASALYGKRDYKGAIAGFRAFVTASPKHARAPDALLAIANSQAETKDPRGARKTIEELLKAYPDSEAAQAGKERLASLK
jgi:tol-pal system protein YbgF